MIKTKNRSFNETFKKDKGFFINILLRNCMIVRNNEVIYFLSVKDGTRMVVMTSVPYHIIDKFVSPFLRNLKCFKKFMECYRIEWPHDLNKLYRKTRIYLRKIHRLAPVFDYKRAKANLKVLQSILARKSFWPKISTQLTIVIYVTDLNDKSGQYDKKIVQKNIRALCNCSAYAFHRTRNILKLESNRTQRSK
ncbi:MAG: hypothetical protein ACTSRI_20370 [Promethearchaeota archaeon]